MSLRVKDEHEQFVYDGGYYLFETLELPNCVVFKYNHQNVQTYLSPKKDKVS